MIIDEPRITESGDEVSVEAAIDLDRSTSAYPTTLWFRFPARYREQVTDRSDGFAATLLPLAMRLGEPLEVRGELSYRLAHGLRDWQHIQSTWKPDLFREVEMRFGRLVDARATSAPAAVGTAFSGGVDSFHALWTHLGTNEPYPPYRISHCLMINGFDRDADLDGVGSFAALERIYAAMATELGLDLVAVRTNAMQFLGPFIQKQSFASFVTAPALVLGGLFARYYVPSSYKFTLLGLYPDGSHPMLDHLLATETLATIHDAGHLTRVAKTAAIAPWPATHDRLRVCFNATRVNEATGVVENCCRCEKCLRTMTTLHLLGALETFRCFPRPLERRDIRALDYRHEGSRIFADEIIAFASEHGRPEIAADLRHAIAHSTRLRPAVRRLVRASFALEQRFPPWRLLVTPPKRLLQRLGVGRGWLY
jgi:hypothetical protein